MADTFTYDLSTDVGKVRFALSDTRQEAHAFPDEEITHALTTEGSVNGAVAACIRVLLADRSRRVLTYSNDEGSVDDTQQVAALQELLRIYGGASPQLPKVGFTALKRHPSDPCPT